MGSGTHIRVWRKISGSNTIQIHTRIVSTSRSTLHGVGSLLTYSSTRFISLLISNAALGATVVQARKQLIGFLNRPSIVYTPNWHIIAILGYIRQDIQLTYLLGSTCTQDKIISSTLNGGCGSLTVIVRMALHSLSTFQNITGTLLVAHGSVRSTNDYIYSTLITIVGALSIVVYAT